MASDKVEPTAPRSFEAATSLSSYLRFAREHGNSTDVVADALREAILEGAIPAGTWLREDSIARELGVSRTPVREALRRVADEGLVNKTAHSGSVVAPLSFDDILALYVVRAELEALAARLAAGQRLDGLVEGLNDVQERMAAAVAADGSASLPELNLEFHRKLRTAAGNSYLERFLLQVEHAVRRLPGSTLSSLSRARRVIDEHQAIVQAIAQQNAEAAAEAARLHMLHARDARIRAMLPPSLSDG